MDEQDGAFSRIWELTEPKWAVFVNVFFSACYTPTMSIYAIVMSKNIFIMLVDAADIGKIRKDKPANMSGVDFLKQETLYFVYWMIGLALTTFISRSIISILTETISNRLTKKIRS